MSAIASGDLLTHYDAERAEDSLIHVHALEQWLAGHVDEPWVRRVRGEA